MNREETQTFDDKGGCALPRHPFFETDGDQASFVDCLDAIDRVRAVIELCDFLKLDDDHGGLSSRAEFGYYLVNVLMQGALSYVSKRLEVLRQFDEESCQEEAGYLDAMVRSLSGLGHDNREQFLDSTSARLNIKRSALDDVIQNIVGINDGTT